MFCNIATKRVEKLCYAFYHPRVKPVSQQTRLLQVAWILSWIKLRGSHEIQWYTVCSLLSTSTFRNLRQIQVLTWVRTMLLVYPRNFMHHLTKSVYTDIFAIAKPCHTYDTNKWPLSGELFWEKLKAQQLTEGSRLACDEVNIFFSVRIKCDYYVPVFLLLGLQ